jgi:NACalpha-BTF3-like transcription factor
MEKSTSWAFDSPILGGRVAWRGEIGWRFFMQGNSGSRPGVLQWVVVLVVGVLVVTVVVGLSLIPRLSDGQKVLDAARPAFAPQRVTGARAGIDIISKNVDMADPIGTARGTAAGEVPKLIAFVSKQTGLSQAEVLAALQTNFPHTTALLQTIPLSAVTAELPGLLVFLEKTLHVSEAQLLAALQANFPAITQAITNLPTLTNGWDNIKDIGGSTRFDGTPMQTVPQLRTYFSSDLIPVLETQRGNFESLDGTSSVNWVAPLLLIVGLVVILFAVLMIWLNLRERVSRGLAMTGAWVVVAVGVGMVALVLVLALVPRVGNGQKLLDALRPANEAARVNGDRAGITMVSAIVDTEDPIMTPQGGAAAEVPKLIAFVSKQTGLSQAEVLAALQTNFPHTTALLQAIPLSAVTAELPGLFTFLEGALHVSEAELVAALQANFPGLAQAITNLPAVTDGWNNVQGIGGATRFDGTPIKTVPDVRTYFASDVIPVLETQRGNYENLVSTSRIDFIGPLVLAVGIVVIVYGLLMLFLAWRLEPVTSEAARTVPRPAT